MSAPLRLGIIGAGNVNEHYLPRLAAYPDVDVRIIGDRHPDRAAAVADRFGIPASGDVRAVFATGEVEAVVNLTPPAAHLETSLAVLGSGKHLYSEKPLAADPVGAHRVLAVARAAGLVVGSAPDVTLGAGFQAAFAVVRAGGIGDAVFARCEAVLAGPEIWHPRPQFLYARGGGPLFDIGPYYVTALVAALGPVRSVAAIGTRKAEERVIGSGPDAGTVFPVEVPTLVTAVLQFASGVAASLLLTFDSASHRGGSMEVLGTTGTVRMPDPNGAYFDASRLTSGTSEWTPIDASGNTAALGPGLVNFARHIRGAEPLVVAGDRAAHVVDVMTAIADSATRGERLQVTSDFAPSPSLPAGWDPTAPTL